MKTVITPQTAERLMERFKVSREEYDADKRWQYVIKKYVDNDNFFSELKADREQDRTQIDVLQKRNDALLACLTSEREPS